MDYPVVSAPTEIKSCLSVEFRRTLRIMNRKESLTRFYGLS